MWTTVKQLARRTSSFARLPCWLSFKTLCIGTLKLFALLPSFVTASFFFGGVWGWREQDNWVIGAAHSSVLASACVLAPLRQLLSLCLSSICDIVMQECEKAFLSSTYFSSGDVPWSNDYLSTWVEYRNFYDELSWVDGSRGTHTQLKNRGTVPGYLSKDLSTINFLPHWPSTLIKYLETCVVLTCTLKFMHS